MDQKELEVTAELAHLNLDKNQLAALFPAFTRMIAFFDTMREAGGDALFAATARQNPESGEKSYPVAGGMFAGAGQLRSDLADMDTGTNASLNEKMLDNVKERDGSFIVIPNVL